MDAYQNSDRFRRNLRHLSAMDADLAQAVEMVAPLSRLVQDEQGGFNLDLGGGALLYPDSAQAAAGRQVERYLEAPRRLAVPQGIVFPHCHELNRHHNAMLERLMGFPMAARRPPFAGFVVVMGLGLGFHLEQLAEALDFKTLLVVEPHDEMIHHSLHVLDWGGLTERLTARGASFQLVRGDDPLAECLGLLRGQWFPYLDGSYLYQHYEAEAFSTLIQRLEDGREFSMGRGWFEDQMLMLTNNAGNFQRTGFRVQKSRLGTARALPAFVVGAGPSLDLDLEDIRRCRDRVVLISASSSLGILLENGLHPDIHCELENVADSARMAEDFARRHGGLSDIILYASATVDPRVAPHFKSAVYFFRSGISSTPIFGQEVETAEFADPTSGNTALHCAISLGFRDIYLFGLDFGARDPGQHHSPSSVYFASKEDGGITGYMVYDFDAPVPGNFGGQVLSGWQLNWGRDAISGAIREAGNVRVINCSDGALIPLTTPMAAEGIDLPLPPVSPSQDLDQALAGLVFTAQPLATLPQTQRLRQAFRHALARCRDALDEGTGGGLTPQRAMIRIGDRLIALEAELKTTEPAVWFCLTGSLLGMLSGAFHHASTRAGGEDLTNQLSQGLSEGFTALDGLVEAGFDTILKGFAHDRG
jgi:hypothetical protein